MSLTKVQMICWALDRFIYIVLFGLGIWFIYHGDIVQRFKLKRTNFAVHQEDISELPTIITDVYPPNPNVTYGRDFHIHYRPAQSVSRKWTKLDLGVNIIEDSHIRINIKHPYQGLSVKSYWPNIFKISQQNFSAGTPADFALKYVFKETGNMSLSKLRFYLRPEKFPYAHCRGNYHDGQPARIKSNLGTFKKLTVSVEKDTHLSYLRNCRQKSYNDLLIEKFTRNLQNECKNPCKPSGKIRDCAALQLSSEVDGLPPCKNKNETKCFYENVKIAHDYLDNFVGPCNKLEFRTKSTINAGFMTMSNETKFKVVFDPPKMTVHEEYLIYDLIAMISAIGGTLGLCIGFSFANITSTALGYFEKMAKSRIGDNPHYMETDCSQRISKTDLAVVETKLEIQMAQQAQILERLIAIETRNQL